jgi:TRAP-type C4-dicarboxylate transport system permease small subunit
MTMDALDEQRLVRERGGGGGAAEKRGGGEGTAAASGHGPLAALERLVEAVALVLFVLMIAVVLLQVVGRFTALPVIWTEELARLLLVVSSLLAMAVAVRRREHVIVDFFVDRLRPPARRRLALFLDVVLLAFLVLWLRGAVALVGLNAGARFSTLPSLAVSYLYLAEAIAIALMILFVAADLVAQSRRGGSRP